MLLVAMVMFVAVFAVVLMTAITRGAAGGRREPRSDNDGGYTYTDSGAPSGGGDDCGPGDGGGFGGDGGDCGGGDGDGGGGGGD